MEMKRLTTTFGLILLLASSAVQAIPTLFFDGDDATGAGVDYSAASGQLSVSAALTASEDISPAPTLAGSTMVFNAYYYNVENLTGGCFFCAPSTKGNFLGDADSMINDLEIIDGAGTVLLTAKFDSLSLEGFNGEDRGEISGLLNATGGSLMSTFDGGNLFAMQLNLNTIFSSSMYSSDFSGDIDGYIEANVSEPAPLALLLLGLVLTGFARRKR